MDPSLILHLFTLFSLVAVQTWGDLIDSEHSLQPGVHKTDEIYFDPAPPTSCLSSQY